MNCGTALKVPQAPFSFRVSLTLAFSQLDLPNSCVLSSVLSHLLLKNVKKVIEEREHG
jgi:hypothetical protein